MGGIEGHSGTALGTRPSGSEHPGPGELAHLARELTGAMASDRRLTIETITTYHGNRALEHEPSPRVAIARLENHFGRGVITRRAGSKALGCLDLRSIEHGKHLVITRLDEAHARSSVGILTAPFLTRKTRDSPLQAGDGILDYERFEGGAEVLWIWRIAVGRSRGAGALGHDHPQP